MNDSLSFEVDRFVATTRSFVRWCEMPHAGYAPEGFVNDALRRLAELYAAAQYFPDDVYEDGPDVPDWPSSRRNGLMAYPAPLPFQSYCGALEPTNLDKNGNVACGDIFDDLLDIHADISDGLWLYHQGYLKNAVWHWRQLYFHWGTHAIGAMHALHLDKQLETIGESLDGN